MKNLWKDWRIVLAAIFLLGALLRFYNLGETSFVADEFLDINASYGYFKTGEWQAWDFNFGKPDAAGVNAARDERAFAYKWQVAGLFHFLPPTEAVARSVSALWGVVSLVLVFWMTASLTKRKEIGLLAAFLYAVSVSALLIDRRLRMYAMFVPVFLAFSWTVFLFLEKEYKGKMPLCKWAWRRFGFNLMYLVPAALLGTLSLHLHLLTVMIAAVVLVYALAHMIRQRSYKNKYGLIVAGFVVGTVVLRLASPSAFELLASSFSFPDNHYGYFGIVLKDYAHVLLAVIFLALGARYLIAQEKIAKEGWWLTLSFLAPLFMAVFMWDRNVGDQYISFAQPFKMMVVAAGIFAFAEFCRRHLSASFGKKAFALPLALSLLILPNYAYFFSEDNTYRQTSKSGNPPYRKVFAYVLKNRTPEDVLITRDLRGYYLSGANMRVENIGGEVTKDKLTPERLQGILAEHPSGWIVLSDNDDSFVSNDAMTYIEKNMERVSNSQVRGTASVYRWGSMR
jgi:hypothetical protein